MSDQSRPPHRSFDGRSGFTEDLELSTASMQDLSVLNKHRVAQHVLTHMGTPFPNRQQLLDMKSPLDRPVNLQRVKHRIQKLQSQHLIDLEHLYDIQAEEYLQEARDKYFSRDDSQFLGKGENNVVAQSSYAKLDNLYKESRKQHVFSEWDDTIDRLRIAHLNELVPLQKKRAELEIKDNEARRQQDARFPGSAEEYRTIRNKEVQLRVAQFLMADKREQEKMMTQYGWAWRQVQPLRNDYHINNQFRSEIQSRVHSMEV